MDVPQIEERLTYLCENDIKNGEIYELLKQLAAIFIFRNKWVYGYSDIDAVCHDVAADTYMRVLSGRTHITRWMYYVSRSIQLSYVSNQKKVEHQIIETVPDSQNSKPTVSEDAILAMSAGSAFSISDEFNRVKKLTFLQSIDSLVREAMSHTKFKQNSKDWLSVYTNVCLSLYRGQITHLRLKPALRPYIALIIIQFKELLLQSELFEDEFADAENDLASNIFYDESMIKDVDKKYDV